MTKTICKNFEKKNAYPLSGGWVFSRNHWNNRAAIIECKGGYTALQSYGTIVLVLYRGKLYRTWSGYSRTTSNHVARFCEMYGFKKIAKSEWENMPCFLTNIEPLPIDYIYSDHFYKCDYFKKFRIVY